LIVGAKRCTWGGLLLEEVLNWGKEVCVSWELGDERTRIRINDKIFISALEQKATAGDVCEMQMSAPIQPCRGGIILYSARIAKVKI
jgi:hypothetical protein